MLDVQIPYIASASPSSPANAQSEPRPGQEGLKRESAGSCKSFSSELHEAHAAKGSCRETASRRTERDENDSTMSSDGSESSPPPPSSCCATRDGQACEQSAELDEQDPGNETSPVAGEPTTQSILLALLALLAQPVIKPDTQTLTQTLSTEQTNTAVESVMSPVMEDGTSLPVTAADSSTLPQKDSKESIAQSAGLTAAIPSGAALSSAGETKGPALSSSNEEPSPDSPAQPSLEEYPDARPEKPPVSSTHEEQPHDAVKMEATSPSGVPPKDQRFEMSDHQEIVKPIEKEQVQRTDESRSALVEHPVQTKEAPEPEEDPAQRHESVATGAWQTFTSQDQKNGMEWSGRDQRDQPSADQLATPSAITETSGPAVQSNPTLPVNGLDHRAFSSAHPAKLPADAHPAVTTPPVTPTDWMPGDSASQTKSMVLELSRADLGQVNIRVAVNQDVVHTYFSSDRIDMGQYLQNGQERLQSALQMSGLDLGRFQVDYDRQSAGRSFQQPASQGQSNGHSSHGESRNPGQEREEFTRETTPRRGMLNLVA